MNKRQKAMEWWHGLTGGEKSQICEASTELTGSPRRWETLTGREIEMIHTKMSIAC